MNIFVKSTLAAAAFAASFSAPALAADEVNIYSYRQPFLLQPLLDAFTARTGIRTNVIFAQKGLVQRIRAEGRNSPADIIMTVDIGRLDGAKKAGVTQAVSSPVLEKDIPAKFRDPEGHWFGVTTRARVIYVSRERVKQDTITYEELADPKWRGRICTRSGQHPYTIGLIASMIAHKGEEKTGKWLVGLRQNLARRPTGNDRAQIKAIYAGECDIALGNNYYMGKMETNDKEPEQKEWAKSARIVFPNAEGRGTHVNISGVMMARYAPNRANALKFMEFLSERKAQQIYAETNFEYPVLAGVPAAKRVRDWGSFKPDDLSMGEIAKYRKAASELVDKTAFDEGPTS